MKQLLMIFANSTQPVHQLEHLFFNTEKCQADKIVLYDSYIPVKELWDNSMYKKYIQLGVDKTEKIMNAFIKGFIKNYDSVILIDNTSSNINQRMIDNAFLELRRQEVVIGPASDGSLCLLGMKKFRPEFFENEIDHKTVLQIVQNNKTSFKELPILESWMKSKASV